MEGVSSLLSKRYLEEIREKEGGSYGVGVRASISHYPTVEYSLMARFDTDPAKADKLKAIVYAEIDNLYSVGVKDDDLEEVKSNMLKVREENLRKNSYWESAIMHYFKHNEIIVVPASYEDIVNAVTKDKVEKFAKKYFSKANKVEVVMSPSEM